MRTEHNGSGVTRSSHLHLPFRAHRSAQSKHFPNTEELDVDADSFSERRTNGSMALCDSLSAHLVPRCFFSISPETVVTRPKYAERDARFDARVQFSDFAYHHIQPFSGSLKRPIVPFIGQSPSNAAAYLRSNVGDTRTFTRLQVALKGAAWVISKPPGPPRPSSQNTSCNLKDKYTAYIMFMLALSPAQSLTCPRCSFPLPLVHDSLFFRHHHRSHRYVCTLSLCRVTYYMMFGF